MVLDQLLLCVNSDRHTLLILNSMMVKLLVVIETSGLRLD